MRKPVVAGLDGSRESLAAAHWAAGEALRRGAPLRLVHAWEGLPDHEAEAALPEVRVPQLRAHRVLREAADQVNERYPQLDVAAEQVRMRPAPALLAQAADAELLVLGSQGPGAVGGLVSGSVAMATVAHARGPVVLVRAGETPEDEHLPDGDGRPSARTAYRDVAAAVDLAGPCDEVLEFAFHAAGLRRAPLRVLHAWHVPLARAVVDAGERARIRGEAEQGLAALLAPWRRTFPGVHVTETLSEGRPAHALVRAADGAGLLVVGRRRRRTGVGPHTGPVAHALIHHVPRPVALVPHD